MSKEPREFDSDVQPPAGGLIVKDFLLSFDRHQRGCLQELDGVTYCLWFLIDERPLCGAVRKVMDVLEGDLVWGIFGAEECSTVPAVLIR